MLTPVREGAFRWSTPDPADDWTMVGHLLVRETGVVFVDPPLIPGLLEAASRLGRPEAVLLTTRNHTRATRYITKKAGISAYLPEQKPDPLDPLEILRVKEIGEFEVYGPGEVLGFRAYKLGEECALLSDKKELLVGDNAIGDRNGNVVLAPDWFPRGPPYKPTEAYSTYKIKDLIKKQFKDIVKDTGATSLLASHGYDIYEGLQARASEL